ncbi:GNAT family N-acetyltransferase [Vibrio superstes]|uniref:N-acetyltransferase n=1 Tax=Vibrio superstes NBRC 103154 TaxID=1219062 RepID=A0A511QT63_9VIBR|nr:N-acetyltransferase [Vibrio superstes]GEM80549.1 N-acetyltransferase [Vibrio superstes NBRC 103154]
MNFILLKQPQAESLKQLFTLTFSDSEGPEEGKVVGQLAKDLIEQTDSDDIYVFAAMDHEELIGAIYFTRLRFESDKIAFLLAPVAIRTDFQGKGVGQKLIKYGLETMAEGGVSLAFTYGDPAFYGRIGFERITTEQFSAPRELSYPHGWLAKSLSQHPLDSITGSSRCVKAFDKPELW